VSRGIDACYDALVDLLESIEHFLRRLDIYTQIPLTQALNEMVAKIMAELLSTLALAATELKEERSSEFCLVGMRPYSMQGSKMGTETLWRGELRGGTTETGPPHPRRGSDNGGGDFQSCLRAHPKYECSDGW